MQGGGRLSAHRAAGRVALDRRRPADLDCGPSTVRNELALLEEYGLLGSSSRLGWARSHRCRPPLRGRSPAELRARPPTPQRLELSLIRREVEEAMRATTETLSQMTNLLAVVSAPSMNTATIRHVEVLALQPQVVMVVIITSTGGVSKMFATFERAVDPGLVAWAGEYLNERLVGLGLGARMLQQRLIDPELSPTELAFLERFAPAFGELASEGEDALFVDGTARLFAAGQIEDSAQINELIDLLERRVALLRVLRAALGRARRVCADRARERAPRDALACARRDRLRDGQAQARDGVGDRAGAHGLRRCDRHRARGGAASCRASSKTPTPRTDPSDMPRDPYEVLGVAARRLRAADQEGLSRAGDGVASRRQRA